MSELGGLRAEINILHAQVANIAVRLQQLDYEFHYEHGEAMQGQGEARCTSDSSEFMFSLSSSPKPRELPEDTRVERRRRRWPRGVVTLTPAPPPPPPLPLLPPRCEHHSRQEANMEGVESLGGIVVENGMQLESYISRLRSTLFYHDTRGLDEMWQRLTCDVRNGKVKIRYCKTAANAFHHIECKCCGAFKHVPWGHWDVVDGVVYVPGNQRQEVLIRNAIFEWFNPPIASAPVEVTAGRADV